MLEIGAPTAQAVLEIIESDPDVHYQGSWQISAGQWWAMAGRAADSCRTTRCVAGWALFLHGHSEDQINWLSMTGGRRENPAIVQEAAPLFGISLVDANKLFYSGNEVAVEALRWIALGKKLDWPTIYRNVETLDRALIT